MIVVYHRKLSDGSFVYLLLYVDDMLIAAKDMSEMKSLKAQLSGEFEMKDFGAAKNWVWRFTGTEAQAGCICHRKGTLRRCLNVVGMQNCKPVSTPLAAYFRLSTALSPQSEEEKEHMSRVPYASAVESIMYAMVCTRTDISHAVSVVSRFMGNPGKTHWQAVKWILRYLKGTTDVGLVYDRGSNTSGSVVGYVDSYYAGDLDRRRSLTGYVFTLSGCAISWKAILQSTVALSTTEKLNDQVRATPCRASEPEKRQTLWSTFHVIDILTSFNLLLGFALLVIPLSSEEKKTRRLLPCVLSLAGKDLNRVSTQQGSMENHAPTRVPA